MKRGVMVKVLTFLLMFAIGAYLFINSPFNSFDLSNRVAVVVSVPLHGGAGESIRNSVELAFEELDYTVGGFNVDLLFLDDGDDNGLWNEDLERQNAELAVADSDVMAYIGTYNSGAAKISIPILNKAHIAQISPANTWPGLTKAGFTPGEPGIFYPTGSRNYFRVCTTDDNQGPAGAVWATELGFKSVYVVDDGSLYGVGVSDLFIQKAKDLDIQILGQHTLQKGGVTNLEILREIESLGPNFIYYGGTTPGGIAPFLQQMQSFSIPSKIMGPDGISGQDFIDLVGPDVAEGVYVTTIGVDALNLGTPEADSFASVYREKYGIEADGFAVLGYETAHVVIEALVAADGKKDRKTVLKAVAETKNFDKVLDTWSFDKSGDTDLILLSGSVAKSGSFEFVKQLTGPKKSR